MGDNAGADRQRAFRSHVSITKPKGAWNLGLSDSQSKGRARVSAAGAHVNTKGAGNLGLSATQSVRVWSVTSHYWPAGQHLWIKERGGRDGDRENSAPTADVVR